MDLGILFTNPTDIFVFECWFPLDLLIFFLVVKGSIYKDSERVMTVTSATTSHANYSKTLYSAAVLILPF